MSADQEIHCNGSGGKTPGGGGLITYRRKRARSCTPTAIVPLDVASASAPGEVSDKPVTKKIYRDKDIGWKHGLHVEGNRYRWQCRWCGIVRSGGVSRLKQHLAGVPEVRKCLKVPTKVSEKMKKHLSSGVLKAIDTIHSQSRYADDIVDKDNDFIGLDRSESNAFQRFRKGNKHVGVGENWSRNITQRSKMDVGKASKEPLDAVLRRDSCGQSGLDKIDSHWRNALEHKLQLPDVSGGGGIQSCIHNALRFGPSVFTGKSKVVDITEDATEPKDRYEGHSEVQVQSQRLGSSACAASDISKTGTCDHADTNDNSIECQNVLFKILCSEAFVLLCNLIFGTFQDKKASEMLDFSLINNKMKNGDYERSPGLFDQDIQQVWEKFRKMGQEIIHLSNNVSKISLASLQKQVGEDLIHEVGEQKFEETCQVGVEQRNSMDSNTIQFPSYVSDRSTKPELTEASCLYKICTCKQCGTDADGKHSLICDGCEAMYHLSCIEPAEQKIPTQSWYCAACITNRRESPEPYINRRRTMEPITNIREIPEPITSIRETSGDGLHENCVVCDRLEVSETQKHTDVIDNRNTMAIDSREGSVSSMESDEPPQPSRTAMLRLCKKCGTCEDDDKRFLVCANTHCPYMYYHIRCLKFSQTALLRKMDQSCWYCPSCLCRACLSDKDDEDIVLCDDCDEGYHTYCMIPTRSSIPKGKWYCMSCNVARAKEGMRRYEQLILQRHDKKDAMQTNEVDRSMYMLLKAAETLSSEDRVTVDRNCR